jgi:glycine dehydrogenase subunit 2
MKYYDKLIFEISKPGRVGYSLPNSEFSSFHLDQAIPEHLRRTIGNHMPEVSELDVVRHYSNVSRKNFGIEKGFYPLGSCTMKYNPKINEELAGLPKLRNLHPLQPISTVQGALELYYNTATMLSSISGLAEFSLNPFAGAHGELIGLMIMKEYHQSRKDFKRTKVIVPDSAHGTNPASATVVGFESIEIASNEDGTVNIEALKSALSDEVAGIMLTNPNTLGIFEKDILEVAELVHGCGGLLYYDGANLNALLGAARPGDMGFDIMHINLHKTFSTPHGGGGPGSGPVGVCEKLVKFLPKPVVKKNAKGYYLDHPKTSIGQVTGFLGNYSVIVKAYAFMLTLGKENLNMVGKLAVLNANYIKESLKAHYYLPIKGLCKHEVVFDGLLDKSTGVTTLDVAKRLLDFDVHPPTIYFPLLFSQSIMIEPVENESLDTIDEFIDIMKQIAVEAKEQPEMVKHAPYNTTVRRLDEVGAARKPRVKYRDLI